MWDLTFKLPFKYISAICPALDILSVPNSNLGEVNNILLEPDITWWFEFPYNNKWALSTPLARKLFAITRPLALIFPEAVILLVTVKSPVRVSVVFSKNELVAEFGTYEAVADVGANELVWEFKVYELVADVGANELVWEFRV